MNHAFQHPWLWFLALFLVPLIGALVVSRLVRKRGLTANGVLAWFVLVCWIGALGVILSQVL
ncbi:hypothetical protein PDM28_10660 [Stenotrophomonas aracearum]|jgi:hypothetical protein|uniref:Transmembrane protein n=1 Tax=Stenotrophomonas aracearum TaxID=3003272 RepID=A0ABY9Y8H6_9GAMM|nr:hypothetical protein [Stenotrophomonas sp. A5588]WNH47171.1 hypothetical protein PDM28_10660 [Stenotrophomonas sp. A5588]